MGNLLSDAAIRDLGKMKLDLSSLRNAVRRLGTSGPRGSVQKYARVGDVLDPGEYEADEVVFDGPGANDWSTVTNGRTWGIAVEDIGPLYSIDEIEEVAVTGVYPVHRFSDGEGVYWGFVSKHLQVFRHPFRGEVTDGDSITIGVNRAEVDYLFKDTITIIDPTTDLPIQIEFIAAEVIALDTADYYVYYDIYKGTSGDWAADLKKTTTWPPVPADLSTGNIIKVIGYAAYSSGYIWAQEMFECPTEVVAPLRGDFEAYYDEDGFVTIPSGALYAPSGTLGASLEETFGLDVATFIWVTVNVSYTAGLPSYAMNANLQSGTFPGPYQSTGILSNDETFNYLIGEITIDQKYSPNQVGSLNVDTTLLNPEISVSIRGTELRSVNFPGMDVSEMALEVGDATNDVLFAGTYVSQEIRGGAILQLKETDTFVFYGLVEAVQQQIIEGVIAAGQLTITGSALDTDITRGLVQKLDIIEDTSNDVVIGGVESIVLAPNAGVAELSLVGDLDAPGNGKFYGTNGAGTKGWQAGFVVTVVTDVQLDSSNALQIKTTDINVPNHDVESDWVTVTGWATTGCP